MQDEPHTAGQLSTTLEGRRHDLCESFAKLIQQAGPAGHRIPQHRIHVVPLHVADHEDLQIVHVHVEHARGAEAHRLQDAPGGGRVFAPGKRERVGGHVRVEADGVRRPPAPLRMGRAELLSLSLRGERGDALPAYRADRIAELATFRRAREASGTVWRAREASGTSKRARGASGTRRARAGSGAADDGRGPHVDEPHAHPAPEQYGLPTPAERPSAAVLAELQPVHGDAQLETQVLLVGDVRRMDQIDVAYRHGPQDVSAQHRPLDDGGRGGDAGGADAARRTPGSLGSARLGQIAIDSVRRGPELVDSARFGPGGSSRLVPTATGYIRLGPLSLDSIPLMPGARIDIATAERAKAPDEAGRLRAQRAGERVRLVEHQEVEPCTGEQLDVLLAGEKQLELLDVGEQDARLPSGGAHDLAGADLLSRIDRLAAAFAPRPREAGFIVGPRRPRPQPDAHHVRLPLRGLADVDPERNSRARQHPAQPHELVFGERVHRIDDDGADAGRGLLVPEREASADDGVEEALGLAGPGAGGDEGRPAFGDRPDRAFLVAVEMGDGLRDPLAQVRVEQPFGHQRGDRCAPPERPRETDVGSFLERRSPGLVEREELPHLEMKMRVGEGVRGELVAKEVSDDVLGVDDGVQGHGVRLTNICHQETGCYSPSFSKVRRGRNRRRGVAAKALKP